MPWQKTPTKIQKMRFISDWLGQEFSMSHLCTRYKISRQSGYLLAKRYEEEGEAAFIERSHSRHTHPNQTPTKLIELILETKQRHLDWGPVTIQAWLKRNKPNLSWPAVSTVGDILNRHGLVKKRYPRKHTPAHSEPLRDCNAPNKVWSADYKGQFKMKNQRYCYPLTITDNFSRFLFCCDGFERIHSKSAIKSFERVFHEYGLPDAIRTDNGYPFAGTAVGGLSALSIWLLKLDIMPERIEPGCPQQNPRHERMHRTLKAGINLNLKHSLGRQQKWFDHFLKEFNEERPHQALALKTPASVYKKSNRSYPSKTPEIIYPNEYLIRKVKTNGEIKYFGKRYFVSELLHGEPIGLEMIDDDRAIVYFGRLKLGIIDAKLNKIIRP
jgi:transposase InsO family protein